MSRGNQGNVIWQATIMSLIKSPPHIAFDASYVCHRAANAIVTQVDPLRVSSDALQIINQFLDEFITLLLTSAKSLDLSRIKTAVVALLPSSLGKNAIVEAELQVKSYTETADDIDYEAYERTRRLDSIPLDSIGALLRQECINHCTLAENNHNRQSTRRPSIGVPKTHNFSISPIVTVYVTSIIEHVAEYVLIVSIDHVWSLSLPFLHYHHHQHLQQCLSIQSFHQIHQIHPFTTFPPFYPLVR